MGKCPRGRAEKVCVLIEGFNCAIKKHEGNLFLQSSGLFFGLGAEGPHIPGSMFTSGGGGGIRKLRSLDRRELRQGSFPGWSWLDSSPWIMATRQL